MLFNFFEVLTTFDDQTNFKGGFVMLFRIIFIVNFIFVFFNSNNVFCQNLDWQAEDVHDPFVIQCKKHFYLYTTSNFINIKKSSDLFNWDDVGSVFKEIPKQLEEHVPKGNVLCAPDVAFFNDRYHLYYGKTNYGSYQSAIALATNKTLDIDDPNYKWIDKGIVVKSSEGGRFNAIDQNICFDQNNNVWMAWGSFGDGIRITRINPKNGLPIGNEKIIAFRGQNAALEAGSIHYKNGYYWLFVSFDFCCKGLDSNYKIMVGRSKSITGPYLDFNGKDMNNGGGTLVIQTHSKYIGTGHCSLFKKDNQEYMVHHYYDDDRNGRPSFSVRKVYWGSGFPVVGEPLSSNSSVKGKINKVFHHVDYDKNGVNLFFQKDNTVVGASDAIVTYQINNNALTMTWKKNNQIFIDKCYLSDDGKSYVGRNQFGAIIRGIAID
jgi:arabinan endo-1,5-alpha-L-arabinosidase